MKDKDEDFINQNCMSLANRQKMIRNSFQVPKPHGSFIFPNTRQGKMSEDLSALEKIILEEEKEDRRSKKIKFLERTLTKELQSVVRKSDQMFKFASKPTPKKIKKKLILEKKCSTVYSETESEWQSSNSDEDSVKSINNIKQRINNVQEESKSKERQKLKNSDSIRYSHIHNKIKFSLMNNTNFSDTIYNDDANKLKDMILKVLKSKIVKFKVNSNNKMCKEKIHICTKLIKEITNNKLKMKSINKLKKFHVEFSDVYNLLKRFDRFKNSPSNSNINTRSVNLSLISTSNIDKIEVENRANPVLQNIQRKSIK